MPGLPIWSSTKLTSGQRRASSIANTSPQCLTQMSKVSLRAGSRRSASRKAGRRQKLLSGLGLDQPPDAAQAAILGEPVQVGLDRRTLLERGMRDHPGQARVDVGETLHPGGLGEVQSGVDRDLGEHQLVDLHLRPAAIEVGQVEATVNFRDLAQPAIAQPGRVVEMDVAVDDGEVRHGPLPDGFASHLDQPAATVNRAARAPSEAWPGSWPDPAAPPR